MINKTVIPKDWKQIKLGEQVKIFNGGTFSSADATKVGIKWLKIANVGIGKIKWDNQSFLPSNFLQDFKKYLLETNDIILALTRPTLGNHLKIAKINEMDSKSLLNQRVGKLICSNKINKQFTYYFLRTEEVAYRINQQLTGTDPPNLSSKAFDFIPFLLPPLPEQNRIVAVLKTWDKVLEKLNRKIKLKKKIKKGLMQKLLTEKIRLPGFNMKWQTIKLGDISNCLDNKRIPLNSENRAHREGNIPYCGANGIVDYIDKFIFDEDIILIAEDGGNFDQYQNRPIAYLMKTKCWVNNHAHVITAKKNTDQNFLFYATVHKNILKYLNGGTRAKLNKSELLSIKYRIPNSKKEQTAIAKILTTADDEITVLEKKRDILEQQKKYLLNNLITGEIRTPENLTLPPK